MLPENSFSALSRIMSGGMDGHLSPHLQSRHRAREEEHQVVPVDVVADVDLASLVISPMFPDAGEDYHGSAPAGLVAVVEPEIAALQVQGSILRFSGAFWVKDLQGGAALPHFPFAEMAPQPCVSCRAEAARRQRERHREG